MEAETQMETIEEGGIEEPMHDLEGLEEEPKIRLTSVGRILGRERRSIAVIRPIKERIVKFRRIVAGDYSDVDPTFAPQSDDGSLVDKRSPEITDIYKVLNKNFEAAKNNYALQHIRTIIQQTSYRMPSIEFEDLTPEESSLNAAYLNKRLGQKNRGGCNSLYHQRLTLTDAIIGGLGWTLTAGDARGRPSMRFADCMNVWWDADAEIIEDGTYIFYDTWESLGTWLAMFPESKGLKELANQYKTDGEEDAWVDTIVRGRYYWDTDTEHGTEALFIEGIENPVHHDENLYRNADNEPTLPLHSISMLMIPGAAHPFSLFEQMLPGILFLRHADASIAEAARLARPIVDVEEGAYSELSIKQLLTGRTNGFLFRKAGKPPAVIMDSTDLPKVFVQLYDKGKENIIAAVGINPYASGGKVDSVNYAAEVNAIESAAGLNAGAITSEVAAHWSNTCSAILSMAAQYDDRPISFTIAGLLHEFGPDFPISRFINPHGTPIVAEDSTTFQPQERKRQAALENFRISVEYNAAVPGMGQASITKRYEEYLVASGVKDVKSHFATPETMSQAVDPVVAAENTVDGDTSAV
jgi:hypothetical protein